MKKLLTLLLATLLATAVWAAVDVNTATEAELDGIKGIGPGLSGRILQERQNAPFKDWADFIGRVGGVGNKSAVNFSKEGLTVNGKKYSAAAAAKAEAKSSKKHSSTQAADRKARGSADKEAATATTPATPPATATAAPAAPAPATGASKN
ncbi:ComEA family DNA-binding protein [Acidovorax soli]|uniref:ComEA family DNA-binding protein n=1 Tax=Acidovorax soli TaxID=592050 RepID=UPI0032B2F481